VANDRKTDKSLVGNGSPLNDVRMSEFTDRTIDLWFQWMRKHPTGREPGRKNFRQEFNLIRAILNWYRNCIDARFVVPVVKRHRQMIHFKPVKARRPDYFMRKEEVLAWIEYLKENFDPVYHRMATLMVLTATRVGEAAGICWGCSGL